MEKSSKMQTAEVATILKDVDKIEKVFKFQMKQLKHRIYHLHSKRKSHMKSKTNKTVKHTSSKVRPNEVGLVPDAKHSNIKTRKEEMEEILREIGSKEDIHNSMKRYSSPDQVR
jgi:hypothetical protein